MVKFYADDYFHIGHAHLGTGKPCQDYSFSSVYGQIGFAVVSDGCSTGRHTDIGSRVIALATAAAVNRCAQLIDGGRHFFDTDPPTISWMIDEIKRQQEEVSGTARYSLNLELNDMLATCSYALLSPAGGFIHLRGDGAVAIVQKNGEMRLVSYQWDKNTPLYPAYVDDNYKRFINVHGGDTLAKALKAEMWKYTLEGSLIKEEEKLISVADGITGAFYGFTAQEIEGLSCVAIFTDGVSQVANTAGGSNIMPWHEVVQQLIAFKNLNGEFVKRRIIRFIKEMQKKNLGPLDDIGCAVVRVEVEEGDILHGS